MAALTVLLAYKAAGSPAQADSLGSFEHWCSTVRNPLLWLGCADPVSTMEKARATDNKIGELTSILMQWRATIEPMNRVNWRMIVDRASHNPDLREALMAIARQGPDISPLRLGKWLGKNANRICNGMWLEEDGKIDHFRAWRLQTT